MAKQKEPTDVDIASILSKINDLVTVFDTPADQADAANPQAGAQKEKTAPEKPSFCEPQLAEIELGKKNNLKTEIYAKDCYNWLQMREIRKGLMARLDVSYYENPLFSAPQMREIRLGLADKLDVSSYAHLILSATDMRNARSELFSKSYRSKPKGYGRTLEIREYGVTLRISDDYLRAFVKLSESSYQDLDEETFIQLLNEYDLRLCIRKAVVKKLFREKPCQKEVCIAEGKQPTMGKSGWFELFFDNPLDKGRIVQPEDEIDYSEIRMIDLVEPDQPLATYHPAKDGKDGLTVTDVPILHIKARELPVLIGMGFSYNPKTRTYTSTSSGYPSYNASTGCLSVCTVYEVNGDLSYYQNMQYDGSVHVHGSILNQATIRATGDVIVDGHMENGFIYSDQNVVIKGGVNGGGTGQITAGGSIKGKFFEYAHLNACGSIEGNYFLNCQITTDDKLIVKGKKARIMGGNINAAISVEAVTIGNYLSNKTVVKVGDTDSILDRIFAQEQTKREISEELEQLQLGVQKLISLLGEDQAPKNSLYAKTMSAMEYKVKQSEKCDAEINRLGIVQKRAQKALIHVHGEVQENVLLIVNGVRKKLEKPIKHGIQINKYVLHNNKNL